MGLDVVVSEILDEGRKRAQDLVAQAEREAAKLRQDAERRTAQERERVLAQAKRDAERHRAQDLARAEFEAKKRLLDAQKALWDDLHAKCLEALRHLPQDRNQRILKALLKKAKAVLPDGVLHGREADRWLERESGYRWGGARDSAGGFAVESATGDVVVDYRYETLLEETWREVMRAESERLFPARGKATDERR